MSEKEEVVEKVDYRIVDVTVESREQIVDFDGKVVSEREILLKILDKIKALEKVIK